MFRMVSVAEKSLWVAMLIPCHPGLIAHLEAKWFPSICESFSVLGGRQHLSDMYVLNTPHLQGVKRAHL